MEEKVKWLRFERLRWEYVLTTPIFAVAIYIYFCARNIKELSAPFILIPAVILSLLAFVSYFAIYLIIRKGFAAMLFSLFCWTGCYTEPLVWKWVYKICPALGRAFEAGKLNERHARLIFNIFFVLLTALLLTMLTHKMKRKKTCTKFVLAVSLLLLGMNGGSILLSAFSGIKDDDSLEIKTEFVKDDSLTSPDIYWIHPDGMLGFDAFEKYYGDPQEALTEALAERGFEISRSAGFEANHSTSIAIPILTSPHAYDTWISRYTGNNEEAKKLGGYSNILMRLLRKKAELQKAFCDAGYTVNTVGHMGFYYPPEGGYSRPVETYMTKVWKYGQKTDKLVSIQEMLDKIENISIYFSVCIARVKIIMIRNPAYYDNVSEYRAYMPEEKARAVMLNAYPSVDSPAYFPQEVLGLYDVLNGGYNSPRLTIIHNLTAHVPYCFNEDGSVHEASLDVLDYYAQHIYNGKVVIGMVDMIIETDPEAIIIIQADHGLHGDTEDFIQAFGEEADAIEIWNSTISAVRVPEQYRNGEEHYMMETPLNIARYLVNNFVGRNYKYLVSE